MITGNAEAAKLSKNTSKAVMVLTIVERPTAKTAYLSGKINTIQLPDVRCRYLEGGQVPALRVRTAYLLWLTSESVLLGLSGVAAS